MFLALTRSALYSIIYRYPVDEVIWDFTLEVAVEENRQVVGEEPEVVVTVHLDVAGVHERVAVVLGNDAKRLSVHGVSRRGVPACDSVVLHLQHEQNSGARVQERCG